MSFRKMLVIVGMLFLFSGGVLADPAFQHYESAAYESAMTAYESMLSDDSDASADLLFNMGNTAYRLGQLSVAKRYYLQGITLSPRDGDIRHNLALLDAQLLGNADASFSFWMLFSVFTVSEGVFFIGMLLLLANVGWGVYYFYGYWPFSRAIVSVYGVVLIGFSILLIAKWMVFAADYAVIDSRKIALKSGPSSQVKTMIFLHEGQWIKVLKIQGEWTQIKLPNGVDGWVKNAAYTSL